MTTELRVVMYHSYQWHELVEQGWVTMWLDGSVAHMIRQYHYGVIL